MLNLTSQMKKLIREEFQRRRDKEEENKKDRFIGVGYPVYNEKEIFEALDTLLDLRISMGKKTEKFENNIAQYIGTKYAVAVNSGSSANLLALSTLLETGEMQKGSEVIVPAATFATVSAPIYQLGLIPVYVDVSPNSWCIDPVQIEQAISNKTKLIMPVHNLGFPADMDKIMDISRNNNLLILEDCCEAHGAEFNSKKVGSFGDLSTLSFFVAHNITTGEGGMIFTSNDKYNSILRSLREFGRLGNTHKRYVSIGNLIDYDTRYIFTRLGYNVRMTDIMASLGIVQLDKLDSLNQIRINHANRLTDFLKKYNQFIGIIKPNENDTSSYYAFPIIVENEAPFSRKSICEFLEECGIETRPMMGGSLPDQPGFKNLNHRIIGELPNTKKIRDRAFFIGCHAGLINKDIDYIISTFERFFFKWI